MVRPVPVWAQSRPSLAAFRRRVSHGGREMAWVALGQIAYLVGVFVGMKLFTHWLSQAEYGRLALGLSLAGIAGMFTFGPIGQGLLRHFALHREQGTLPIYFRLGTGVVARAMGLILLLAVPAALTAGHLGPPAWGPLILAATAFALASGLGDSLNALATARRWRPWSAFYQGLGTWLRIALAAAAVVLAGPAAPWVLAGYALGALLSLAPLFLACLRAGDLDQWRRGRDAQAADLQAARRRFQAYVVPFLLFAGFAATSLYADRWVIQAWLDEAQVGLFFAVMQIANAPIALFFGILGQTLIPVVFDRVGRGAEDAGHALLRLGLLLALPVLALFLALGLAFDGWILRALTTPAYATRPGLLALGMLGYALFHSAQFLVTRGLAERHPGAYLWPKALQALGFLALAPLFLQFWGLYGVAWALCASSGLYLGAVVLANRRLSPS